MMDYIDSHAHLTMCDFDTTQAILERARKAGINRMLTVSTDETNWESNRQMALSDRNIFYTLGLHPHTASRFAEVAPQLNGFFDNGIPTKCVAIGEMGLDFHYDKSPREIQIDVFEAQLALAARVGLPVIIHCRDAFEQTFASIRKQGLPRYGGVMHCFTGDATQAKEAVDLGLHISFSGILTFKKADQIREAARTVPLERILLETDCPYLSPEPYRGKPNEPGRLAITAQRLGAIRQLTIEDVAYATCQNTVELFRL
ncbi:MAG: TatD family hydrolase [Deltaproteobacteria bacterium]|nr:TatD family hydrolase [Deltaproteobacteria bacterium]MBI3295988.1 TatD family hydrolase [Deltaproteobacteria bacterium]